MTDISGDFQFKPAKRENVKLLIALASASGGGKTKTALEIAKGLSPSGKIGMLDTEAGRGLHYASDYQFHHADLKPPFTPMKIADGVRAAERAGLEVLIIDSMSHEHDGEGGILDWANELAEGTPKPGIKEPRDPNKGDGWKDWLKKPVKTPGNWKDPKLAHKQMMNALLQARIHIIFCLRAEEKIRIIAPCEANQFKTQIEALGWVPICEKRFMFEMTLSLTLRPDAPGRPQFDLPHKIQDQHRHIFPPGKLISSEAGRLLEAWAQGDGPVKAGSSAPAFDVAAFVGLVERTAVAANDAASLKIWWESVTPDRKRLAAADEPKSAHCRSLVNDRIAALAAGDEV